MAQRSAAMIGVTILAARPDVKYGEPNYRLQPTLTPSDLQFSRSWALENDGQTGEPVVDRFVPRSA